MEYRIIERQGMSPNKRKIVVEWVLKGKVAGSLRQRELWNTLRLEKNGR